MPASRSMIVPTEGSSAVQFERYVADSRLPLFRFAVVLCGDPVLAGDLVTDVLGRAFERWHQVSAADDPHAYVRRMVVNEFVSWQRRRIRSVPHAEVDRLAEQRARRLGTSGPDPGDAHAERDALLADLARLPDRQRAAIVLRYFEDLTDEEIAAALDCRVGTVRSAISRGLGALRVITRSTSTARDRTQP